MPKLNVKNIVKEKIKQLHLIIVKCPECKGLVGKNFLCEKCQQADNLIDELEREHFMKNKPSKKKDKN
jgi:hypothetical protein